MVLLLMLSRAEGALFGWQQIQGFPDLLPYGHLHNPPPPFRVERPKVRGPRSQGARGGSLQGVPRRRGRCTSDAPPGAPPALCIPLLSLIL